MSKETKLMKNTAIIAIGSLCTRCISFLMLPLYTTLLSTEEYGVVDLITVCVNLCVIVLTLQLEQGIFRFLIDARDDKNKQCEYISTTILFVTIINGIFVILFGALLLFVQIDYANYILSIVLATVGVSLLLQIARGLGNNVIYASGSFVCGGLNVILNAVFIAVLKWNVEGMLAATLLANVAAFVYLLIKLKLWKYVEVRSFSKKYLQVLIKYSAPLIPNTFCWWIINASDRIVINMVLGDAANGIYSVSNKFPSIFTMVTNIFQTSWSESASENIRSSANEDFIREIMDKSVRFYSSVNIGIIALMPFVFKLLVGDEFASAYYYIPFLMTGAFFHGVANLYGSVYIALKKTKEIAKTTLLAAVINLLVNIVLIRWIGMYAAAFSTMLAYFIISLVRHTDVNRSVEVKYAKSFLVTETIVYLIIGMAYYAENTVWQIIALIGVIPYCIFQNRKMLNSVVAVLKQKMLGERI